MKKVFVLISVLGVLFNFPLFSQELAWAEGWKIFNFTDAQGIYCASSELNKPADFSFGPYSPKNLLDNNFSTAWVEASHGNGVGQWVCRVMSQDIPHYIAIANGYQKSHDLFEKNNRIKRLKLTIYVGFTDDMRQTQIGFSAYARAYPQTFTIELRDSEGYQFFNFPLDRDKLTSFGNKVLREFIKQNYDQLIDDKEFSTLKDFYFVKFQIMDVYPGTKWNDACISEIHFQNKAEIEELPEDEKVVSVYQDSSRQKILVKTDRATYTLASARRLAKMVGWDSDDTSLVVSVLSTSPSKQWAIVDLMSGGAGRRTAEEDVLCSVHLLKPVSKDIIDMYNLGYPMDFAVENGKVYVVFDQGQLQASKIFNDLKMRMEPDYFAKDGQWALAEVLSLALQKKDHWAIISCVEKNFVHHYLQEVNHGDTLSFINKMLVGKDLSSNKKLAVPLNSITKVVRYNLSPYGDQTMLDMIISDGQHQVETKWTVVKTCDNGVTGVFVIPLLK